MLSRFVAALHRWAESGWSGLSSVGVRDATIASSEALFERHDWLLVFAGTISPPSTKLTCIAAGAFGLPVVQFIPALFVGCALRFAILTVLLRLADERLQERLTWWTPGGAHERVE